MLVVTFWTEEVLLQNFAKVWQFAYIVNICIGRESISDSRVRDDDDDDTRLVTDFRTDFRPKLERVRKAYIFLTRRSFPLIAIQVRLGIPHSPEEKTG